MADHLTQQTHFNPLVLSDSNDHSYRTWDSAASSDGELQIAFQGCVPNSNVGFICASEAIGIPLVNELNSGNNTGVKHGTGLFNHRSVEALSTWYLLKLIKLLQV